MEKSLNNYVHDNVIYSNQFAIIAFIVMVVFKIANLPSYMYQTAGRDAWIVIGILMAIEAAMFFVVLYITKRVNLLADNNKWLYIFHAFMYVYAMIRLTVLYSGLITYTSSSLFDQGRIDFIILAFALVIPYIASKGGNSVARLFEMLFYFVMAILLVMVLTPSFKADFSELTPIFGENNPKLVNSFIDYSVWFGDYVPLLYFTVKNNKNKIIDKASVPVAVISATIGIVVFYIAFIAVYGEAGGFVSFAFNRMSVFNTLSELLGATNFLSILVWMIMSILQITMIFLTACNALMCIIKNRILAIVVNTLVISALQWFFIKNLETAHNFAIGYVKYFVIVCAFAIPIAMVIYAKLCAKGKI